MLEKSMLHQPLEIGGRVIPNRVVLAPMSGVTDKPFRDRALSHGAGLVVSEMVASGELAKGRGNTRQRIERPANGLHMVQLAGREAAAMATAAHIAASEGADIIDINMGCPAKKVTGGYCGSALMRNLDHAVSLIDAVVASVSVPVTVKMRLGWDDESRNAPELAARAEQAGVSMITVHGRTRCQFYQGRADWAAIRLVKQAVSVPVVANGDVESIGDAQLILDQSGADAVMIGRGSYGQPWLPGTVGQGECNSAPGRADLADYVIDHYDTMLAFYGIEGGIRQARKHLGWYLDRHGGPAGIQSRNLILRSFDPAEVRAALRSAFSSSELDAAA